MVHFKINNMHLVNRWVNFHFMTNKGPIPTALTDADQHGQSSDYITSQTFHYRQMPIKHVQLVKTTTDLHQQTATGVTH